MSTPFCGLNGHDLAPDSLRNIVLCDSLPCSLHCNTTNIPAVSLQWQVSSNLQCFYFCVLNLSCLLLELLLHIKVSD